MKRMLFLLLILLLLTGCDKQEVIPTEPPTLPTEATEPPVPWVEATGMDWDTEGILKEMPLNIPDGLHYTAAVELDGDLLLWSMDTHRKDSSCIELCLVELDDGTVIAQRDVPITQYIMPRTLGDRVYLCDSNGGTILQLDKSLQTVQTWSVPSTQGTFYISSSGTAYLYDMTSVFQRYDLNTGETAPVLEGNPEITWVTDSQDHLIIKYYAVDNGAPAYAVLDLATDECFYARTEEKIDSVSRVGSTWLYEKYLENYVYYLHTDGEEPLRFIQEQSVVTLLGEGYLLESTMDGSTLRLYRMDGTLVSACSISEDGYGYASSDMIWNETLGGYFFLLRSYDDTCRLLFWDISRSIGGNDLTLEPLPEDDAVQAELEARAAELEEKYGLIILVGNECDTEFTEFTASQITDRDRVLAALDVLDEAMSVYPEGFIRQLCQGDSKSIQIHLISDLEPDGYTRTGNYIAFVQPEFDHQVMGIDIDASDVTTYHHEMSHIIDQYLQWDAYQREDALYSDLQWEQLNPDWFAGYTYDYSAPRDLEDATSFIDSYSTISPTEDRARVLEYAMSSYGWYFEDAPVLQEKLAYYCRCIRDAFDTSGWPEILPWEQYLN